MLRFWRKSSGSKPGKTKMSKRELVAEEFIRAGISPGMYVRSSNCLRSGDAGTDEKRETYPWVLSTEQPVEVFDWKMCEFWPEVLLVDGLQSVDIVPLLDNHRRWACDDVLGSVRNITVSSAGQYKSIDGDVLFSGTDDVANKKQKVDEGHIRDGSVGYTYGVDDVVYVGDDTKVNINGKEYVGPVKVVTRWWIREFSLTPIGADTLAKVKELIGGNDG